MGQHDRPPRQDRLDARLARRAACAAALGLVLLAGGCGLRGGSPDATGSISRTDARTPEQWRSSLASLAAAYDRSPSDKRTALTYASGLRATGQDAQANAVLRNIAIAHPQDMEVLGAYGKSLADIGQYREAVDVLSRAQTPERPNWRVLSSLGAVHDQMGDADTARRYYEAALKIAPGEPQVLANLGLSLALARRLPEAETALRQAAAHPRADHRVRANLALVLGLQGRFQEAETMAAADLPPDEAAQNVAYLRSMLSQQNSWQQLKGQQGAKPKGR
jgi:Flp pilus assembly protein TadD